MNQNESERMDVQDNRIDYQEESCTAEERLDNLLNTLCDKADELLEEAPFNYRSISPSSFHRVLTRGMRREFCLSPIDPNLRYTWYSTMAEFGVTTDLPYAIYLINEYFQKYVIHIIDKRSPDIFPEGVYIIEGKKSYAHAKVIMEEFHMLEDILYQVYNKDTVEKNVQRGTLIDATKLFKPTVAVNVCVFPECLDVKNRKSPRLYLQPTHLNSSVSPAVYNYDLETLIRPTSDSEDSPEHTGLDAGSASPALSATSSGSSARGRKRSIHGKNMMCQTAQSVGSHDYEAIQNPEKTESGILECDVAVYCDNHQIGSRLASFLGLISIDNILKIADIKENRISSQTSSTILNYVQFRIAQHNFSGCNEICMVSNIELFVKIKAKYKIIFSRFHLPANYITPLADYMDYPDCTIAQVFLRANAEFPNYINALAEGLNCVLSLKDRRICISMPTVVKYKSKFYIVNMPIIGIVPLYFIKLYIFREAFGKEFNVIEHAKEYYAETINARIDAAKIQATRNKAAEKEAARIEIDTKNI